MLILTAVTAGFILDMIFGDPLKLPHPVVLMGKAISALEKLLRKAFPKTERGELWAGLVLTILLPLSSFALSFGVLYLLYSISPFLGLAAESFWCFQILAVKSLRDAALRVYKALLPGDIKLARVRLSYIVGRDTENLDESQIIKAAVETVAENTTDGAVSPLIYMFIGGAPLGLAYKSINTMDSMIGYKNENHLYFGRAAAILDDWANFIPARLAGVLMVISAPLFSFDAKSACKIFLRDRKNHASPNSAHTEAACAGALGIALSGEASYFGVLAKKPQIGDDRHPPKPEDIVSAIKLLYGTSVLCFVLGALLRFLIILIFQLGR